MPGSYFKTAFRHLSRSRVSTSINIVGLTLGMTCAFLTILFVKSELSYDNFHKKSSRLFRLNTIITNTQDKNVETLSTTGQVQGPAFKNVIPDVEDYTRILGMERVNMSNGDKSLAVKNLYADENFFDVFSFPLLQGNPASLLSDPYSVVLSEATAMKFYGTTDVIGKLLKIEEGNGVQDLTITGVANNAPLNSSLQFDVVIPFKYLRLMFTDNNWLNQYLTTFILLRQGANPVNVEQKFIKVFEIYAGNQLLEAKMTASQYHFGLQAIRDIHLHPYGGGSEEQGLSDASALTYSYTLTSIVALILLMACMNFINLNIADSIRRAKEIGIRKMVGSSRAQIVGQLLTEAAIVCCIAYMLSIVLGKSLLEVFNKLADKKINFSYLSDFSILGYGAIVMIICVCIAGIYPALVLSIFKPAEVLYNKHKVTGKNAFGKGLIVLQFTFSVVLVIATFVYYSQMNFISKKDLGYDPADIIKIHLPVQRADANTTHIFKSALSAEPSIKQVTGERGSGIGTVRANHREFTAKTNNIDESYLQTLKIPLAEGRNFSSDYGTDSANSVIVNETFIKTAGWKNAIGQEVMDLDSRHTKKIIGVVKDYHYGSLKEKIEPQVLGMGNYEFVLIKVRKGKTVQALAAVEMLYKKTFPEHYFLSRFLDTENASAYQNDKRWQQVIGWASGLATLICCIGLFGLASFAAYQRVREIGIRKVLGATVLSVAFLLSKDFLKLVILSIIIAYPVAYYFMQQWLQSFAYRIPIEWWIFALTAMLIVFIAMATISLQAIKAATANPVTSLRSE